VVAQFRLGECYADGAGVSKDEKQAAAWYQRAADAGKLRRSAPPRDSATPMAGGVAKDEPRAVEHTVVLPPRAMRELSSNLDVHLQRDRVLPKDALGAVKWYSLAAEAGEMNSPESPSVISTAIRN